VTALETIEKAQTSVDQIQRGLEFVQVRLDRADDLATRVDEIAVTASTVVKKARRVSRFVLVLGAVTVVGGVVAFVIMRRRKSRANEDVAEDRS